MRVILLSPHPERLSPIIEMAGDTWISTAAQIDPVYDKQHDFIVCYGYRHILDKTIISELKDRIINLHISALPWNRGADPNFWSWIDDTPKGVTIHQIDEGIDTGSLLVQVESLFESTAEDTLATTYARLQWIIMNTFAQTWPSIRRGSIVPQKQPEGGSYHRLRDKDSIFNKLPLGWHTPISIVQDIGAEIAASRGYLELMDKERADHH